jgi:hypothetical protein
MIFRRSIGSSMANFTPPQNAILAKRSVELGSQPMNSNVETRKGHRGIAGSSRISSLRTADLALLTSFCPFSPEFSTKWQE